jgi:hypothetical protein
MNPATADLDPLALFLPRLPAVPYPGLRPFDVEEWPIFFGRERMTDEVIGLLLQRKLVVVHGASGGGKSSLVRAGVQARLQQELARSGFRWRTCALRPGSQPLTNLARALAGLTPGAAAIDVRRALNQGREAMAAVVALLRLSPTDRVCILIDQFEELFRFAREVSREESNLLTDLLVGFEHAPTDGVHILVTMRSEFLGDCARMNGLPEAFNRCQYLLPRMTTEDLLRAIREPAVLYDGEVTERLAERLVADARGGQDELPLIQHGLARLWGFAATGAGIAEAAAPKLDLPDYEARGPLHRLLSEHADLVADEAAGDGTGQAIIRVLFRALTDIDADGRAVRRPQRFGALMAVTGASAERLSAIMAPFRATEVSFIAPFLPEEIEDDTTIDISHEALIRCWQRIADPERGWLQEEFRDGLIWRALLVQADSFSADPKSLLSESTTETRNAWIKGRSTAWARRYGGKWDAVRALIVASQRDVERKHAETEADQLRERELLAEQIRSARRRYTIWLMSGVVAVCLAFAALAAFQWLNAERARADAVKDREVAVAAQKDAEKALRDAKNAANQAKAEALSALHTQAASVKLVASAPGAAKGVSTILEQLQTTTDPYQIALLAQSIATVADSLTQEQSQQIAKILANAFVQTKDDLSATVALARTLEALLPKIGLSALAVVAILTPDQARNVLPMLRQTSSDDTGALERIRAELFARTGDIAPRLYIQIAQESQRRVADELKQRLEGVRINGAPLDVPGIQLNPDYTGMSQVRCFRVAECTTDGPIIVYAVNSLLATPEVTLENLGARYANATNIRGRHYELWLGPGDLAIR